MSNRMQIAKEDTSGAVQKTVPNDFSSVVAVAFFVEISLIFDIPKSDILAFHLSSNNMY